MKKEVYWKGVQGKLWGILDTVKQMWIYGICEDTPMLAEARLYQIIGKEAREHRYEPRMLPDGIRKSMGDTIPTNPVPLTTIPRRG